MHYIGYKRYLKATPGKGLFLIFFFKKSEHKIVEAFTDADCAGSTKEKRSALRYCAKFGETWLP